MILACVSCASFIMHTTLAGLFLVQAQGFSSALTLYWYTQHFFLVVVDGTTMVKKVIPLAHSCTLEKMNFWNCSSEDAMRATIAKNLENERPGPK